MNVKELRKKLNLTQKEFGLLLGFKNPQVRISELENGKQKGSNQLIRYCEFLNYLVDNHKKLILSFLQSKLN